MKKITIALFLTLLMVGCGEQTIDASSEKAFQKSVLSMKYSLPLDQQDVFHDAVEQIIYSHVANYGAYLTRSNETQQQILAAFDGKTVDGVLEQAAKIKLSESQKEAIPNFWVSG